MVLSQYLEQKLFNHNSVSNLIIDISKYYRNWTIVSESILVFSFNVTLFKTKLKSFEIENLAILFSFSAFACLILNINLSSYLQRLSCVICFLFFSDNILYIIYRTFHSSTDASCLFRCSSCQFQCPYISVTSSFYLAHPMPFKLDNIFFIFSFRVCSMSLWMVSFLRTLNIKQIILSVIFLDLFSLF